MSGKDIVIEAHRFFTPARVDILLNVIRSFKKLKPEALQYLEWIGKKTNIEIDSKNPNYSVYLRTLLILVLLQGFC